MLSVLFTLALAAAPAGEDGAVDDPGTIAIANFKGLDPREQQAVIVAIKEKIEASNDPALKALLALRDRAKKELVTQPGKALSFYEHSVYAPVQAARSFVDPTSANGVQQYEMLRPWESEPPFNYVRVRYDFATNAAHQTLDDESFIAQVSDFLFGCIPDNDALVAWITWKLDKRGDLDGVADYFGHAYCDRVGNCYTNITMYDAFASQEDIERSDIDVIAFARNILKDDSFVSPIPGDSKQQKLYDSIGEAFLDYFRYRSSIEYVADLFVNPDSAMRKDHEALREYYWTLFAKADSIDDLLEKWNGFKDREAFKAAVNAWRKEPGVADRAVAWRVARNQVRWTVNGIATAVLKERSIWPPEESKAGAKQESPPTGGGTANSDDSSKESHPEAAAATKSESKDTVKENKMLNVGDVAPDFSVPDESGKVRTLTEFKGKTVLIWFYPKANTPG